MSLTDNQSHQLGISFKKLIGKEFTDDSRPSYGELGTKGLDISYDEIYAGFIPSDITAFTNQIEGGPVAGNTYILTGSDGANLVKYYYRVAMAPDASFNTNDNRKVWYIVSKSSGIDNSAISSDERRNNPTYAQKEFLSDKYGDSYGPNGEFELLDGTGDGNKIFPSNGIGWFFDYKTGILSVEDPPNDSTAYYITTFQYLGPTLSSSLADGTLGGGSSTSGIFTETSSVFNTTNDVGITGSFTVGGTGENVDFTNAGGGVSGSFSGSFEGAFTAGTINASSVAASQGTFTNLTVTGTTTTVNTTNLNIEDQFILINSGALKGSGLAADTADKDGGLIVDFGGGSGSALFYDAANRAWGIKGTDHTSIDQNIFLNYNAESNVDTVIKYDYTISVVSASGVNPSASPTYGNSAANSELGTMHINHADESIWIYS